MGTQLSGSVGTVRGTGKRLEQCVSDGIGISSVVEAAAGAHQVCNVPVGSETYLAIVEVKLAGGQGC